jgi:hypothetical protein
MSEITKYKYWLAFMLIAAVLVILTTVLLFTPMGGEIKATIITFLVMIGTLVTQYYFRKAGSNEGETGDIPKVNTPVGSIGARASGWGTCPDCSDPLYNSTTSTAKNWEALNDDISDEDDQDDADRIDDHLENVKADLKGDKIKLTDEAMSSRMLSYLAAHEDEFNEAQKEKWIALGTARAAWVFEKAAKIDAPENYNDVADYNKYWRSIKKDCKADWSILKPLLMTLRSWLKLQDTGEW